MASENNRSRGADVAPERQWHRHPVLSNALRIGVFVVPIAASVGVATLLGRLLPRADSVATTALWIGVITTGSLLTLVAFERAARRLLPLAALLNLSLIFPDKAPARFAVARRTGKPRDLQASLERAHEAGHQDEARGMQAVIELVLALSVHDKASRGHSERVRVFTDLLADELKIAESGRNRLRWGALLHDIGKLEVPPTILNKPGKPSEEEWAVLHRHPEEGARLVAPLLPWLGEWGMAVVQHHERFDGTGYPHQLKGHNISLAARIVAVADSYEVMTAPRAYKRPMSVSAARKELVRVAGTQLDPVIVRAFLNVSVGRLWRTIGFGAWIGQIPTLGRVFSFGGFGGAAGSGAGMGLASAAATTILAFSGVVAPGPSSVHADPLSPQAVASAPSTGPGLAPRATFGPHSSTSPTPTPTAATTATTASPTAAPTAASTATTSPTPAPSSATTTTPPTTPPSPQQTLPPNPRPTPPSSPPPTAAPTPTPAPTGGDPWSCPGCTNTSPGCTSYCSGANKTCVTYCTGYSNKVCTTHCVGGGDNKRCVAYCDGNNPQCQTYCRNSGQGNSAVFSAQRLFSRRVFLQADNTLNRTMTTTTAMVMRPLY
ncbi:MAG: HD-GYP domain-containing protein [Candidatus Dormibacteraeota bacterium]|uniref:HD-GYP domain-containing protein n=1 Tax=Candidatus Amunia macphersoniae TaxID=3127014 RepID=A0A934NF64_9BACT|nr:HD-GYP domain-containing protein [Candidatus Dormibacteraeota bacterium]